MNTHEPEILGVNGTVSMHLFLFIFGLFNKQGHKPRMEGTCRFHLTTLVAFHSYYQPFIKPKYWNEWSIARVSNILRRLDFTLEYRLESPQSFSHLEWKLYYRAFSRVSRACLGKLTFHKNSGSQGCWSKEA